MAKEEFVTELKKVYDKDGSHQYVFQGVDKMRPYAYIALKYNSDYTESYYEICYKCPTCGAYISGYRTENACDKCGTFFDWGKSEPKIKVIRTVEWK